MGLQDKSLAIFLSAGLSLELLDRFGILKRELKRYNRLAENFKEAVIVSYGSNEGNFARYLSGNMRVLPKKLPLPSKIYQFFVPILFARELKGADLYHADQMISVVPALIAGLMYKKILVVRNGYQLLRFLEHEKKHFFKKFIAYWLERLSFGLSRSIIVTSTESKEYVSKRYKTRPEKIEVIPNYIDTDLFRPSNIPKEKGRIIFVGRLEREKNLFNLIEALSGLGCKLVMVGQGTFYKRLENYAAVKKVSVEFKERIDNEALPQELNRSEIFILPSYNEGCPKTLLEAMSSGLACIGTDVQGIRDIIRHEENGFLCGTGAVSIRDAILKLKDNGALKEKLGRGARSTILQNFNMNVIIDKEIALYRSII